MPACAPCAGRQRSGVYLDSPITFYPVFLLPLFQVFPAPQVFVFAFVFVVAQPQVFALVFAAVELQVVFVSEPQASVDIAVPFVFLVPVSVVVVEVDSPGRPRFFAFPNIDHFAIPSSSVEVVGEESVHSPIGARTNYGLCSIPSSPGPHHNKN